MTTRTTSPPTTHQPPSQSAASLSRSRARPRVTASTSATLDPNLTRSWQKDRDGVVVVAVRHWGAGACAEASGYTEDSRRSQYPDDVIKEARRSLRAPRFRPESPWGLPPHALCPSETPRGLTMLLLSLMISGTRLGLARRWRERVRAGAHHGHERGDDRAPLRDAARRLRRPHHRPPGRAALRP